MRIFLPCLAAALSIGGILLCDGLAYAAGDEVPKIRSIQVTGTGTDMLNGAIVHSKTQTPTGMIQRSTETVELNGDLTGRILYHVTSTFDFANDSLVNTGDQVFSGTVAGSDPVMIHDGSFRFHANLKSGADAGSVRLVDHIAGPWVKCMLQVIGTGKDVDANPTFNYSGHCDFRDK